MNFGRLLEKGNIQVSVPCRVDLGGTLDISTFYLPLAHLRPGTFNLALDMRTHVTLAPWTEKRIKISSKGFDSLDIHRDDLSFDHPMGLMSAVVQFFNGHGLHVHIESTSPPKSALGGSSSAAVAIISALYLAQGKTPDPEHICWLAQALESSVAGVPCGIQDHTAAAYGGVNFWQWSFGKSGSKFERVPLYESQSDTEDLNSHILVAYCGIPHVSKDINKQWVEGFIQGKIKREFSEIVEITKEFTQAMRHKNWELAAQLMNKETAIRCEITPQVLDKTGKKLFERAKEFKCGARFTGAGGGGCLWAVGPKDDIRKLSGAWKSLLEPVKDAQVLTTRIDTRGIVSK